MRCLLVGYGRAGRRLGRALDRLGVRIDWIDPDVEYDWGHSLGNKCHYNLTVALTERPRYGFALIATPPSLHLSQIRQCLDAGLPVLCEKPLCDWGQLPEAEELLKHPLAGRVGMCFNYRWHPAIQALRHSGKQASDKPYSMLSAQHREALPDWGLVLDHLPHTIDTLLWISGAASMTVEQATQRTSQDKDIVWAKGKLDEVDWRLSDAVYQEAVTKAAWINGPCGMTHIHTPPETVDLMTEEMLKSWLKFVEGEAAYQGGGLFDGVRVQRVLEEVKSKL
jgi:predicted dehydrogenase